MMVDCKFLNTCYKKTLIYHQMALCCTILLQLQHKTPSIGQVHKLSNRSKTNFDNLSSITIGLEAKERKREVWRKNSIGTWDRLFFVVCALFFREFGILQLGCSFADRHLLSAKVTNTLFLFVFPKPSKEEDSGANC